MTTATLAFPPHSTHGETRHPSTNSTMSTDHEIIIFPNGTVLYGENIAKEVDTIVLGGVRTAVTKEERYFLENGDIKSVLTYVQNLFSNITSRRK